MGPWAGGVVTHDAATRCPCEPNLTIRTIADFDRLMPPDAEPHAETPEEFGSRLARRILADVSGVADEDGRRRRLRSRATAGRWRGEPTDEERDAEELARLRRIEDAARAFMEHDIAWNGDEPYLVYTEVSTGTARALRDALGGPDA